MKRTTSRGRDHGGIARAGTPGPVYDGMSLNPHRNHKGVWKRRETGCVEVRKHTHLTEWSAASRAGLLGDRVLVALSAVAVAGEDDRAENVVVGHSYCVVSVWLVSEAYCECPAEAADQCSRALEDRSAEGSNSATPLLLYSSIPQHKA